MHRCLADAIFIALTYLRNSTRVCVCMCDNCVDLSCASEEPRRQQLPADSKPFVF